MNYSKTFFKFLVGIIFILFSIRTYSQVSVPSNLTKYATTFHKLTIPKNAGYVEMNLPKAFSKKGDVDYTKYVQDVLNRYDFVVMPNFPVLINNDGLKVKSNQVLFFQPKSKVIYRGIAKNVFDDIIKVYDVRNVKIYNPVIEGSKYLSGQKLEFSAGICINDSENIEIYNANISKTWGDGIFVGSENGKISRNIVINGGFINDARRNGISIVSVENLKINNIVIANTKGTLPESAIDIEPSLFKNEIKNVNIKNVTTFHNKNGSVVINLNAFNRNAPVNKEISIHIDNLTDYNSNILVGFVMNSYKQNYTSSGAIVFKNVIGNDSKMGIWKDNGKSNINVIMDNVYHLSKGEKKYLKY